jgi:hypothetical protein
VIVHRILDVVFRSLDTLDAVRARVRTLVNDAPQPASSAWAPVVEAPAAPHVVDRETMRAYTETPAVEDLYVAQKPQKAPTKAETSSKKASSSKPASSKQASSTSKQAKAQTKPKKKSAAQKAQSEKPQAATRKGSVDRKGDDFDSPRARAVAAWIKENGRAVVADDADLDNKKTLARVVWAVGAAEAAGSEQGLTAADASALLATVAGLDVFSTNVARAFRDESDLFVETVPDGRSKRYKLTSAGHARLAEVATRP